MSRSNPGTAARKRLRARFARPCPTCGAARGLKCVGAAGQPRRSNHRERMSPAPAAAAAAAARLPAAAETPQPGSAARAAPASPKESPR